MTSSIRIASIALPIIAAASMTGFAYSPQRLDLSRAGVGQSSLIHAGLPRRAVDGNRSPFWSSLSCTHTELEDFPFWTVDLGSRRSIDRIDITNRLDSCNNTNIDPYVDVCNPGTFQGKRWYCEADPSRPATGEFSCSSGWIECVPGCNPGRFDGRTWSCADNPDIPVGQTCPTQWNTCEPTACSERLDGVEVWIGDLVEDSDFVHLGDNQFVGPAPSIIDYLDGDYVPPFGFPARQCNGGQPVHLDAGQKDISVDCGGAVGQYVYIAKRAENSVLTLCEVDVYAR